MNNIATISLCDLKIFGDTEHYMFKFSSIEPEDKGYVIMNSINHGSPYPAIFLTKNQLIALRDWCNSLIFSK